MTRDRLSATSYVVLGMIGLRGPSTSYDLKRAVGRSIGYFWQFPHAQLYSEPLRLVDLGLLSAAAEGTGRKRRTYSLTEKGRQQLGHWLAEPTNVHFQMRDIAELKLFFNEIGDPANVGKLAREQIKQHEARIGVYEEMQRHSGHIPGVAKRMITLQLGLEMEHAALRFWSCLADEWHLEHDDSAEQRAAGSDSTTLGNVDLDTAASIWARRAAARRGEEARAAPPAADRSDSDDAKERT